MDLNTWKSLITSGEPSDRSAAADVIPDGGTAEELVPYLAICLKDPDSLVRTCAAETIGCFPGDAARVALLEALASESDPLTRAYLLSSLGGIGGLEDVRVILDELGGESHPIIRLHGATGLLSCVQRHWYATMKSALMAADDAAKGTSASDLLNYVEEHLSVFEEIAVLVEEAAPTTETRTTLDKLSEIKKLISSKLRESG